MRFNVTSKKIALHAVVLLSIAADAASTNSTARSMASDLFPLRENRFERSVLVDSMAEPRFPYKVKQNQPNKRDD